MPPSFNKSANFYNSPLHSKEIGSCVLNYKTSFGYFKVVLIVRMNLYVVYRLCINEILV